MNFEPSQLGRKLGLYIHWPYCKKKCPYCDFNSHVRLSVDYDRMADAYVQELQFMAEKTQNRVLSSIYFGGGTPSTMPPEITARLIDTARALWGMSNDMEITLEANPTSVEMEKLSGFRTAGVNRISLGVQALDDNALQELGREHTARDALSAVEQVQSLFERANFDLIYARPKQSVQAWLAELEQALSYIKGHISLYQLTIEPNTEYYHRWKKGEIVLPDEDRAGALFTTTNEVLKSHGLNAYEVSNYATAGDESRHNLLYWRYDDYIGVGPGAHGRLTDMDTHEKIATVCIALPEKWLQSVEQNGHGMDIQTVDKTGRLDEMMLMGLRLGEGVPESRLIREIGQGFDALNIGRLETLLDEKLLVMDNADNDKKLRTTDAGRLRLNAVLEYLL